MRFPHVFPREAFISEQLGEPSVERAVKFSQCFLRCRENFFSGMHMLVERSIHEDLIPIALRSLGQSKPRKDAFEIFLGTRIEVLEPEDQKLLPGENLFRRAWHKRNESKAQNVRRSCTAGS